MKLIDEQWAKIKKEKWNASGGAGFVEYITGSRIIAYANKTKS